MKKELVDVEIWPKVVPSQRETQLHVRGLYPHSAFLDAHRYAVHVFAIEGRGESWNTRNAQPLQVQPVNGVLAFNVAFGAEQEYQLEIRRLPASTIKTASSGEDSSVEQLQEEIPSMDERDYRPLVLRLYALDADLFGKRPWKGDLHMHSHHSDGRESPGFVAASCRRVGMDFMAVTDHEKYAPSVEAQRDFQDVSLDMLICRGEEVHPPENPVHMIHFGGTRSINDHMRDQPEAYRSAVGGIEATLTDVGDPEVRYHIASCCWAFQQMKDCGGFGIFCHPYWRVREGYHIAAGVTDWMFAHQPFDAYEIIGGYHKFEADSNTIQVARYHEERAEGRRIPIVGVSDAHGCEASPLFGWYWTLAFAEELTQNAVLDGIRNLHSVAVEMMEGEVPRAYGPLRLVKYALFLMGEVLPLHDALCQTEAEAMFAHLKGEGTAAMRLSALQGRVAALYSKLWASA